MVYRHENAPELAVVLSGGASSVAGVPGQGLWENAVGQAERSYGLRARWCNWPPLRLARVRCERESVGVVLPAALPVVVERRSAVGRSIGLDVHRDFCEVAIADGGRARSAGRVATSPEELELFAQSLAPTDRVVLEATGNALAIARILEPHVAEVVLAHAKQVRAISHAKVKTDKIDAKVLADLLAADLIPAVWIGDERRGCCAGWSRVAAGWSSAARRSRTRSRRCCIATSRAARRSPTRSASRAARGWPSRSCRSTSA